MRESVLERIAQAACPKREPLVIEIGPGKGALTERLIPRAEKLIAIEVDPALGDLLARRFASAPGFELVREDVLQTGLSQWGEAVVAGNLHYYITSPIVEKTLAMGERLRRAVFLVQREVAQRLAAGPGTRDYGFLSVRTQCLAQVERLFPVPAKAFRPPPKVDSEVVRLTPRAVIPDEDFLRFAGACFRQKRKTLRNNLVAAYGGAAVGDLPEGGLRAEQMSIAELAALYERLKDRLTRYTE